MEFEWDASKDRSNLAKHGIDFETAALVFGDPHLQIGEDRMDEDGEQRWLALGLVAGYEPLLLVVHVYRETNDGEEIVRITSARKASARERRAYFQ